MFKAIEPVIKTAAEFIHRSYIVANSVSCSYLIFNLLNFWNLTLLYTFLQIKTLPNYISNNMERMASLLFVKNTLILWMSKIITGERKEIDSDIFSETEKLATHENGYVWFGGMGFSSRRI